MPTFFFLLLSSSFRKTFKLKLNWVEIMRICIVQLVDNCIWTDPFLGADANDALTKAKANEIVSIFVCSFPFLRGAHLVLVSAAILIITSRHAYVLVIYMMRVCARWAWDCVAIIKRHCSRPNLFCTHTSRNSQSDRNQTTTTVLSDPFHIVANCSGQNILHFCFYAVGFCVCFFFVVVCSLLHSRLFM